MSTTDLKQRIPLLCTKLKQLLEKDLQDLSLLTSTLTDESLALKQRDAEAISSCSKTKAQLIKQIEDRARAKVKLITASGAPIKAGNVQDGITSLGDLELTNLWQSSLKALQECKDLNTINGLVIERSRTRNQKIMDMVRGKHQKPKLYGNKGGEQSYAGSNRIAKA